MGVVGVCAVRDHNVRKPFLAALLLLHLLQGLGGCDVKRWLLGLGLGLASLRRWCWVRSSGGQLRNGVGVMLGSGRTLGHEREGRIATGRTLGLQGLMLGICARKHVLGLLLLEIHEHVIGRSVLSPHRRLLTRGSGAHRISRGSAGLGVVG